MSSMRECKICSVIFEDKLQLQRHFISTHLQGITVQTREGYAFTFLHTFNDSLRCGTCLEHIDLSNFHDIFLHVLCAKSFQFQYEEESKADEETETINFFGNNTNISSTGHDHDFLQINTEDMNEGNGVYDSHDSDNVNIIIEDEDDSSFDSTSVSSSTFKSTVRFSLYDEEEVKDLIAGYNKYRGNKYVWTKIAEDPEYCFVRNVDKRRTNEHLKTKFHRMKHSKLTQNQNGTYSLKEKESPATSKQEQLKEIDIDMESESENIIFVDQQKSDALWRIIGNHYPEFTEKFVDMVFKLPKSFEEDHVNRLSWSALFDQCITDSTSRIRYVTFWNNLLPVLEKAKLVEVKNKDVIRLF